MIHSPAALWHERQRFLPAALAVAFSALLIVLQFGLLLGLFSLTSLPIDHARADLWVGHPAVPSVDLGRPIPERWLERVALQPEVVRTEVYLQAVLVLNKADGRSEMCTVIGTRLDADGLGAVRQLTPWLREKLTEPGAIVVDEAELDRLGLTGVGDVAELFGHRVRVVGLVRGLKALATPLVFCSLETARMLCQNLRPDQVIYLLAGCRSPADAAAVAQRLRNEYHMAAYTRGEFTTRTRIYWLTKTKAGIATGWTALLGLVVGTVITSQTLYGATMAYRREYATLRALGVPRRQMATAVLGQALWVGLAGILLALPAAFGMAQLAEALGIKVLLHPWLLTGGAAVTLAMALVSSLFALRALWRVEPVELLR